MKRREKLEKIHADVLKTFRFHEGSTRHSFDCGACRGRLMEALEKAYRKGQRSKK
jgi:hypothetical protein